MEVATQVRQDKARKYVENNTFVNVSSILEWDDALAETFDPQALTDEDGEYVDVFAYYLVDSHTADALREQGEPVGRAGQWDVWGRTTTGQSIYMDACIEEIANA